VGGEINSSKMATSNIRIRKVCEWCGKEFEAQKCSTRFCCKRCAEHAYKDRQRQKRKQETEAKVIETIIREKEKTGEDKVYLSVQETADLIGVKRNAVYQLIYRGKLKAFRLTSSVTRICQTTIEHLLNTNVYVIKSKAMSPATDEDGSILLANFTDLSATPAGQAADWIATANNYRTQCYTIIVSFTPEETALLRSMPDNGRDKVRTHGSFI